MFLKIKAYSPSLRYTIHCIVYLKEGINEHCIVYNVHLFTNLYYKIKNQKLQIKNTTSNHQTTSTHYSSLNFHLQYITNT